MRIEWLGHASWKIKTADKTIYIDPYQGNYDEQADIILSTHSHQDHCDPSKVKLVRGQDTTIVAPADCEAKLGGPIKSLTPFVDRHCPLLIDHIHDIVEFIQRRRRVTAPLQRPHVDIPYAIFVH